MYRKTALFVACEYFTRSKREVQRSSVKLSTSAPVVIASTLNSTASLTNSHAVKLVLAKGACDSDGSRRSASFGTSLGAHQTKHIARTCRRPVSPMPLDPRPTLLSFGDRMFLSTSDFGGDLGESYDDRRGGRSYNDGGQEPQQQWGGCAPRGPVFF